MRAAPFYKILRAILKKDKEEIYAYGQKEIDNNIQGISAEGRQRYT